MTPKSTFLILALFYFVKLHVLYSLFTLYLYFLFLSWGLHTSVYVQESVGYRDSLRLLELYPRSTYVVLDRGTHGITIDTSETSVFGALVRDWIFKASMYQLTSAFITRTLGDLNDHTDPTGKKLSRENDFKQFLPHLDKNISLNSIFWREVEYASRSLDILMCLPGFVALGLLH